MKYQLCSSGLVLNQIDSRPTFHGPVLQHYLPYTFKCMPEGIILNPKRPAWINEEFPSPVFWSARPLSDTNESLNVIQQIYHNKYMSDLHYNPVEMDEILETRDVSQMKDWITVVNDKGELIILYINPKPVYMRYVLFCYTRQSMARVYRNTYFAPTNILDLKGGMEFNGTVTDDYGDITLISPKWQSVTLYKRTVIINCRPVY